MKNSKFYVLLLFTSFFFCSFSQDTSIEKNIKMYSEVWDEVLNNGKINLINDTNFDNEIALVGSPENITGIENFKAYYANFLSGFSEIDFAIKNIFGQGDNLVKHWNFKGVHTGDFFGMPASGKPVDVEGVTLVKMKNGKIAREQDFMDNMVFLQQLGVISDPANLAVINGIYAAFSAGDIPAVLSVLDMEVEWNEAEGNPYADGNPYIGPEAVLNGIFARIGAEHEYFKLTDIKLHEMANNQVLATLRYDAKLSKNARVLNVQAAHLWTLNDGKVTRFQQYADTRQLAEAVE